MRIRRIPGLASSAALAAVTLGVFGTFQNYGPESAVRRFHDAVLTNDKRELEQVVEGSPETSAVLDLKRFVRAIGGAGYSIQTSERATGQVEILALYQGRAPAIWVVVKARDRWRIDPYLTLQGLKRLGYR